MLLVRSKTGRADALTAGRPRRDLAHRQGSARQRVGDHDARGRRVGGDRPASLPRRDGRGVCGARGRARDGRRVRHPRLFGAAARARLRRPPRARRHQQRRDAAGRRRCDRA